MDAPELGLPTRDTLAVVSHRDQRMVKWFEDVTAAGALIGTAWDVIIDGNSHDDGRRSIRITDLNR